METKTIKGKYFADTSKFIKSKKVKTKIETKEEKEIREWEKDQENNRLARGGNDISDEDIFTDGFGNPSYY